MSVGGASDSDVTDVAVQPARASPRSAGDDRDP